MSIKIKSCSPGTKIESVLNDQALLCFFRTDEVNKYLDDYDARSLNDTGAYIGYSTDPSVRPTTYSGESTTEDSGGVQDRIKDHRLSKPLLTNFMVLLNSTVDGHRKLEGSTFKLLEHLFKCMLTYASKSDVMNIKRTGGSVSPEVYQKIICPLLVDLKYSTDSILYNLLTPSIDTPSFTKDSKRFVNNDDGLTQVYLKDNIILKHSHFRFPHRQIRESNDCFTLLTSLINSGICIPYVYESEVVMKFIVDTNLNETHVINTSQKRDFVINERLLVNLMGSRTDFTKSFK